jgi:hypothetical protein
MSANINKKCARSLIAALLAAFLIGCGAKPQIVEKAVYIDRPCPKTAEQIAPAKWIGVKWIALAIEGIDYAATPDIAALLGNLERTKPTQKGAK